jgi:hypothetical protein
MLKKVIAVTKTEIVEHPDFVKLVKAAVAQFKLKRRMDRLQIDMDELVHLVRCFIWGRTIKDNYTLSTVVYKFTLYTVTDEMSKKFGLNGRKRTGVLQAEHEDTYGRIKCHRSSGAVPTEATDLIQLLRTKGFGYEVDLCLLFESRYKNREVAAIYGKSYSRQRVDQIKSRAYKLLRSAVDDMGICDE